MGIPTGDLAGSMFENEQVLARDMLVEVEHPTCGKFKMIGNPVKVAGVKDEFRPPPLLGEHTDEVLEKLLGGKKEE